jgi:hypothetical protein
MLSILLLEVVDLVVEMVMEILDMVEAVPEV